ncbi:hypothetical protein B0T13DRAFT_140755 [Neurospora crassa]|nr:hypothetical protein B0T13DRAFT_249121 [Neurospora crassa]KAK3503770.1 hypothetical protein B0T13DRAFT_140755 [Neurospora crassa]
MRPDLLTYLRMIVAWVARLGICFGPVGSGQVQSGQVQFKPLSCVRPTSGSHFQIRRPAFRSQLGSLERAYFKGARGMFCF